jgi:hypothetical protein
MSLEVSISSSFPNQHMEESLQGINKCPSLKGLTLTCSDMQMVPEHPQCSIQRWEANEMQMYAVIMQTKVALD